MKQEIVVPQVGESITSGVVASWSRKSGDYVRDGDELFELETDKATLPVPATVSGILTCLVEIDTEVTIGQVVATIDTDAAKPEDSSDAAAGEGTPSTEEPHLSPAVRRIVDEKGLDPTSISGSGPGGRILEEDALQAAVVSASAKTATSDKTNSASGVVVPGSTESGPAATGASAVGASPPQERRPMSRLRRRIAQNLVRSKQSAAHLTTFNEVDMSAVMDLRGRYKEEFEKRYGIRLGFMSFFLKAASAALEQYPEVNAFVDGTDIVYNRDSHIGVALSSDAGLIVPVVRNVGAKNFAEIETEIADFITRAGERRIMPDEFAGGTFTVSNGGVFGSMLSTPIPNPPQTAVLGMHAIQKRSVVVNDEITIRPMMYLALTYDHRIIDGREAIGFLNAIRGAVQDPARLLVGL